jgi:AcrR family transcriptional regulator
MPSTKTAVTEPRSYHHGDLRRVLIDAALALVAEEQGWNFSLREVARRAGVSHNAPYNHFAEKQDLLTAVATTSFEALRARMLSATAGIDSPRAALVATVRAYVLFAVENPALFRLMFGPALVTVASHRPAAMRDAGNRCKAVLDDAVLRGARSGDFAVAPDDESELASAALSLWSASHGLTMLVIDRLTGWDVPTDELIEAVLRRQFDGLVPR